MHETEVKLVFRGSSGLALPTMDWTPMHAEAVRLGRAHMNAITEQAARQAQLVSARLAA